MYIGVATMAGISLATAAVNRKSDCCNRFSVCQEQHLTGLMARNFVICHVL